MEDTYGYIQSLQNENENLHRRIDDETREIALQITNTSDAMGDIQNILHKRIDYEVKDILSMVDSRLDKLENKLKGMIPPTNDELMKRIENIEEQSHRLRMNM